MADILEKGIIRINQGQAASVRSERCEECSQLGKTCITIFAMSADKEMLLLQIPLVPAFCNVNDPADTTTATGEAHVTSCDNCCNRCVRPGLG